MRRRRRAVLLLGAGAGALAATLLALALVAMLHAPRPGQLPAPAPAWLQRLWPGAARPFALRARARAAPPRAVAVFGAAGALGHALALALRAQGTAVVAVECVRTRAVMAAPDADRAPVAAPGALLDSLLQHGASLHVWLV